MALPSEEEMLQDLATADAAGDKAMAEHIAGLITAKRNAAASVAKQDKALMTGGGTTGKFGEDALAASGGAFKDMALGGQQAINALTGGKIGDRDALNAEAAAKKKLDDPLMATGAGKVGNFATQALVTALPFSAATRAASLLPRTNMAMRGASAMLPAALVGAGEGVLTPDEDYSLGKQVAKGAALGMAGDVAGRVAGLALRPVRGVLDDTVGQYVRELREGLPNARLLAENLSGNDTIKALTNALAQIPFFGAGVKSNRRHNLEEVTRLGTRSAGLEVPALTPAASDALHTRVAGQAQAFREGAPLPVPDMDAALARASADAEAGSRLFGNYTPRRQIESARSELQVPGPVNPGVGALASQQPSILNTIAQNASSQPGSRLANLIEEAAASGGPFHTGSAAMPRSIPVPPAIPPHTPRIPTIDAGTAMDVRRELGDQVFQQQHGLAARGAEAIKNEVEDAFRRRHGNDFDRWLAEHGGSLDVRRLQGTKNAITPTGQIRPEEFRRLNMSDAEIANPTNPFYRTMRAASERMASPSLSENRSLMVRLLMGGALPGAGAGLGAAFGDEGGAAKGALAGLGTLGTAAWLLGTPGGGRYLTGQNRSAIGRALQSDRMQELLRLMGITALD